MTSSHTASPADLQAAWDEGTRALREGRNADAVGFFQRITASGQATAAVWVAVAIAEKARGDRKAERAALEQARALDPRDIRALIMTADHYRDLGDARAASSYYSAVVGVAVQAGTVEKALEIEVGRAQHMRQQYAAEYEAHLRNAMAGKGIDQPEARRAATSRPSRTGPSSTTTACWATRAGAPSTSGRRARRFRRMRPASPGPWRRWKTRRCAGYRAGRRRSSFPC